LRGKCLPETSFFSSREKKRRTEGKATLCSSRVGGREIRNYFFF